MNLRNDSAFKKEITMKTYTHTYPFTDILSLLLIVKVSGEVGQKKVPMLSPRHLGGSFLGGGGVRGFLYSPAPVQCSFR